MAMGTKAPRLKPQLRGRVRHKVLLLHLNAPTSGRVGSSEGESPTTTSHYSYLGEVLVGGGVSTPCVRSPWLRTPEIKYKKPPS
eukprot:300096-Rhodomonas_salina.1